MKAHTSTMTGLFGVGAALAMTAPAQAASGAQIAPDFAPIAPLATLASTSAPSETDSAAHHRRYCRWGRCYRHGWYGHRGVSAGDVFAGAVIIGSVAAVASAASSNNRREREVVVVDRDRTPPNPWVQANSTSLDSVVSQCRLRVERDMRVQSVDNVRRLSSGWEVTGQVFDGSDFTCQVSGDGRVSDVQYRGMRSDAGASAPGRSDTGLHMANVRAGNQLSDDVYARARASIESTQRLAAMSDQPAQPLVPLTAERMPAYPGGPLPEE